MKRSAIVFLFLVSFAASVQAWEKDLHYGLTLWLCLQAGFSNDDALEIAKQTQGEDEGVITPATFMMPAVLLFGDVSGSKTVSRKHFPTTGKIDAPPNARPVEPNSVAARSKLNEAIGYPGANALELLGEALHPFQDSWSHQGIPDVPFRPGREIRPNLSWAHPQKRGGWYSHQADITSFYRNDAVATAEATYDCLVEFRKQHPSGNIGSKPWHDLIPDVQSFAEAATKREKQDWFEQHLQDTGVDTAALAQVDVPGPPTALERAVEALEYAQQITRAAQAPNKVLEHINRFLRSWFQERSIAATTESIDLPVLGKQFGPEVFRNPEETARWCKKVMTMYLTADHGAVEAAGHGNPAAEGYRSLPESPVKEDRFASIKTHIAEVPAKAIVQTELPDVGLVYTAILSFSDLPNEVVMLAFNSDGRLVRLFWIIDC